MKSPEVYKILRSEIGPWAKEQGFKRAQAMLSYYRPHGKEYIVFWFQVSQDGWDAYAGSKFTVELQRSGQPVVGGACSFRKRLGYFLDGPSREEVRKLQNQIVSSLSPPPSNYFLLEDDRIRDWYLGKFRPESRPYSARDDIWFRYYTPAHLHVWAQLFLQHLPRCIQEIESHNSSPQAADTARPWWRFW